ncbi:C39 family peptidase [Blastopirellula retiformator]|uniref:Peptidase C39 family protein n=1 Tax=Blastopirellula retiformator TaxID=2527970 RepID=A0A5C5V263_9BACT|nr:cysteine peptidase family C39 domain-containing protein [Blastopirellula retiformator]TWT32060.1 Peptidase C39 family protein [Blastopirellula retiformator]
MLKTRILSVFALVVVMTIATSADAQTRSQFGPPVRSRDNNIQAYARTWTAIRDQNIVKQQRDFSCGAAALATICRYYWGDPVTENQILGVVEKNLTRDELKERFENGLAISDLRLAAVKLGYLSTIGRLDIEKLAEAKVPLIVAIRLEETNHFVVVRGVANGWVFLADPARGNLRIPQFEFERIWIENAVLVVAKKGKAKSDVSQLEVRHEEMARGWVDDQIIRTFPEKPFRIPFPAYP